MLDKTISIRTESSMSTKNVVPLNVYDERCRAYDSLLSGCRRHVILAAYRDLQMYRNT